MKCDRCKRTIENNKQDIKHSKRVHIIEAVSKETRQQTTQEILEIFKKIVGKRITLGGDFPDQTKYNMYNFEDEFEQKIKEQVK